MITASELRTLLAYDPETGLFRWLVDKGGIKAGVIAGTTHRLGYIVIVIDGQGYLGHRLAWLHVYGRWPSLNIDHKNRDKSDNRLLNLREATDQQNQINKGVQRNNTSGHKGVVWSKAAGKWQGQIRVDGKLIYLGQFVEKDKAIAAYQAAAERHFSAFAAHLSRVAA